MLSVRVIAIRAVIASRLGMFLYPTGAFFSLSALILSTLSVVSGSPPEGTFEGGDEARLDVAGDAERVVGALTAIESAFDAAVVVLFSDIWDPVRRSCAARRGRVVDDWLGGGAAFPEAVMRAAS